MSGRSEVEKRAELAQTGELLQLFSSLQTADAGDADMIAPTVAKSAFPAEGKLHNGEMCFYRISQLAYDEDYPRREAFENVLLSLDNPAFNFVYILEGTKTGIELYIGVVQNQESEEIPVVLGKKLMAANYGQIVASIFEGNFNGSRLAQVKDDELEKLIGVGVKDYQNAGMIIGIPSENKKESGEKYDFQGMDRLVNSMLGLEWRLAVVCEPVRKQEIQELRAEVYELYNRLALYAKKSLQHSVNDTVTVSFGESASDTKGKNWGYNITKGTGSGRSGEHWSKSESTSDTNTEGQSRSHQDGTSRNAGFNRGTSDAVTLEIANKHAQELMKYIDEDLLERLKTGYSKGLFKTSVYYMAKEPTYAARLKAGIMAMFQGDASSYNPLHAQSIDLEKPVNRSILNVYQYQYAEDNQRYSNDALLLLGRPCDENGHIGLGSYLTAGEISLLAGLPQKEVPGLTLKESVEFGLNLKSNKAEALANRKSDQEEDKEKGQDFIDLGCMVQKGRELEKNRFCLSRGSLAKHTFVAGVTGSGKTTTCHKLLKEAGVPYLVIEPAKTEYGTLIGQNEDVVVFTLGNEAIAPFRLNPFELIRGEVISAHIDMIKATFTSAFPMEASMPQLLEEAIYQIYENMGWNIDTNRNEKYGDNAFNPEVNSFPILSDLLAEMKEVVKGKHFSAQMEADYIGSLVSRLSNLTVGSKGSMLNCAHSTDFTYLAHHNVVLEMEELKSPEDKSLFMGFVLSRLSAVIRQEHRENPDYRHITLVEEAHRLLSKVEYGDSGSKKAAVETFTDLLAEVRKYGEGLIIVDQIPNKLAPEVLKNTNTKIIHKILARDDKEAVGDTMLMDDKQKEYLSALDVGNAIVFSENTDKPVHVRIAAVSDTSEDQIADDPVRERFLERKDWLGGCYEYPEVMAIMGLYRETADSVMSGKFDWDKIGELGNRIREIADRYQTDTQTIWRLAISRYDRIAGKSGASGEDFEERITALTEFFDRKLCRADVDKENIGITKEIAIYLMY